MLQGPDLLRAWCEASGLTQAEIARRVPVSQPTLSEYIKGTRTPRTATAFALERLTGGKVPAAAWAEAEVAPDAGPAADPTEAAE